MSWQSIAKHRRFGTALLIGSRLAKRDMDEWSEARDESGELFYINNKTKETSWEKPTSAVASAAEPVQNPRLSAPASKQGYLHKKGAVVKNWKTRFFVLTRESLTYWETGALLKQKGIIMLNENTTMDPAPDGHKFAFRFDVTAQVVQMGGVKGGTNYAMRTFHLATDTDEDRQAWIKAISQVVADRIAFLKGT